MPRKTSEKDTIHIHLGGDLLFQNQNNHKDECFVVQSQRTLLTHQKIQDSKSNFQLSLVAMNIRKLDSCVQLNTGVCTFLLTSQGPKLPELYHDANQQLKNRNVIKR
jgi:hypothetical protein